MYMPICWDRRQNRHEIEENDKRAKDRHQKFTAEGKPRRWHELNENEINASSAEQ